MDDKKTALHGAEKGKALAAALAQIEKQFGKGSVMRMDASMPVEEVQTVSTGSLKPQKPPGGGYGLPAEQMQELAVLLSKNTPVTIE